MNRFDDRPMRRGFWRWLEEEHPSVEKAVWLLILGMSLASVIISIVAIGGHL